MATFPTGGVEYGKVCGRIIGGATGTPNAFQDLGAANPTVIDDIRLVDGLTITHSAPIQHIWTLAAARSSDPDNVVCPCKANVNPIIIDAVNFAGVNFFCDTTLGDFKLLWNGQCSATTVMDIATCCGFNTPPYFTATLPTRTTADVDAYLCRNENRGDEDVRVRELELYVQ